MKIAYSGSFNLPICQFQGIDREEFAELLSVIFHEFMAGCKKTRDMMSMNETPKQDEKDGVKPRKKKHLLNDQSFEALTQLQKEIVRETGWMPSLNKLVNALVNTKTLLYLKKIMLKTVKDHQP